LTESEFGAIAIAALPGVTVNLEPLATRNA
jgi:hypothetical protein